MGVRGNLGILKLATNRKLVDTAAACLGVDDVILWGVQAFCKPAGVGKSVPWHQDGPYWPIQPMLACTVWVAIDEATPENGGLHVISGSHTCGELPHQVHQDANASISVYLSTEQLGSERLAQAHALQLTPGQMSVHDAMLVHGSGVNRSSSRRAGVACHYMAATCHFRRDIRTFADQEGGLTLDFSERPLMVVKGQNRHPENTKVVHVRETPDIAS
mmetsp:Transcript_24751/g.57652  ORF Transcript_24751/g.57652 Transcript_24751/m.57652 type:complete len:217 (-) Transcript_24751:136-786(-)